MYADDLVLMSCDRSQLELMLKTFDDVCGQTGMSMLSSWQLATQGPLQMV